MTPTNVELSLLGAARGDFYVPVTQETYDYMAITMAKIRAKNLILDRRRNIHVVELD